MNMPKSFNQSAKSYRLGSLLFHSSLPTTLKQVWRRLLPVMTQEQLQELLQLLEKDEKLRQKLQIACTHEWKRMEVSHEMQMAVLMKEFKV